MDRISEITRDCFDALIQLRGADASTLPTGEALHGRLCGFVDAMMRRAAEVGLSSEETRDTAYAVVALADEIAAARSEELRQYWSGHQLQMHYFQENVAGVAFFTRLESQRRDPRRREVLRVYYVALLLGFQGRYRVRGGDLELMTLIEELQRELGQGSRFDDVLSPSAERPEDARARGGRSRAMLWAAAAVAGLCGLLYLGLYASASSGASRVADRIASLQKR